MARVLYGLMGNTNGHVMRTLAIISRLPQHEFFLVGGGRVPQLLGNQYPCLEVPVLRTVHCKQRVSLPRTVAQIVLRHGQLPGIVRRIVRLIEQWRPDCAVCDREFFLPYAAQVAGLPCFSLDHSHILHACQYPVPPSQRLSWYLAMLHDWLSFNQTRFHLVISFFRPPLRPSTQHYYELHAPVLRPEVTTMHPAEGESVLVYQTSPTFRRLLDALQQLKRPVLVYGMQNQEEKRGNLFFRAFHPTRILEDLAQSAYVIANGGHNLLCEAFYLGKPVFCFPVACLFEQFLNAWYVKELGYGDFSTSLRPTGQLLQRFEANLEMYSRNLRTGFRYGTEEVVRRVDQIVSSPSLILRKCAEKEGASTHPGSSYPSSVPLVQALSRKAKTPLRDN
ncbi:glycosyltransferase family protein [Candidatus Methylacidithermus pantelleriae]|uniref:Uncharacterized protein n=1 Tax=Candidatus Methylacidithermus pantelleriae TaxID=2744239 RepID=A0A8J2FNF7_9BACT|nr:glycosyltransferase family protein [Candidatus Methylacidithermus pantelleriae]CAF0692031.1 conserved hypothetical protein [Candidatus Methylacidithermus pantelleriae]